MDASPEQNGAALAGSFFNRTRTSPSIPKRLLGERKVHLLPLYALLRTSDLAREGIENSASYRFADHIYRCQPSGRLGIGRLLDGALLRSPAARSMRSRFSHVRAEILAAARAHPADTPFRVLSVPCGIARDLVESAEILRGADRTLADRAFFFGIDLDPRPLELSRHMAEGLPGFRFIRADALNLRAYPSELDLILSTGLGEFLPDEQLARFYAACHGALRQGGRFVTSATRRDRLSDFLLRELAELRPHYRESDEVVRWLGRTGFHDVSARPDDIGLQTLVTARR
jgi:SAM-dependent methyltransferase